MVKEVRERLMAKDKVKKLVVSCIPCNKRVELPIEAATLTFHSSYPEPGTCAEHILLDEFYAFPQVMCKDCLGACYVEILEK